MSSSSATPAFQLVPTSDDAPSMPHAPSPRWLPAPIMVVVWLFLAVKVATSGGASPAPSARASGSSPLPSSSLRTSSLGVADVCSVAGGAPGAPPPPPTAAGRAHIGEAFTGIYDKLTWGSDGEGSGAGSTLAYTAPTRNVLEMLIYRHGVTRVLDAPCGSAHWWPPLLARIRRFVPCLTYHGMDVVTSVIESNTRKYAGDTQSSFAAADLSTAALPRGFDLSLTRDALQHLPLLDAIDVIAGIARAGPRLSLFGSYVMAKGPNRDIKAGDYYLINLLKAPFLMNGTLDVLDELSASSSEKKFLLLYTTQYLSTLDFDAMRARAVKDFGAVRRGEGGGGRELALRPELVAAAKALAVRGDKAAGIATNTAARVSTAIGQWAERSVAASV